MMHVWTLIAVALHHLQVTKLTLEN
eukprot:SAG11_NODE_33216_length_278_cov_1.156425_1_plen_24_part_10